ncbi:ImmA/IrrE family metallo-endopeptidase [Erythrobacter sp. sf7]|uniref:ImmA/IrrE family metallo-endopeptidase n=1 Tax=Erythrobacter fulvus TaxID=2987523 RepID=A0ABT5JSW7_9SPHN|nr:ImmA/IrrE family metallo-endopeptidase [Erythrobacter fulvus]MDC8755639.1 ImmA/IrrE family metallo-endopeptidase [Erythrobacter fulvus]
MKISRLDLDGATSSRRLAERIHEIEALPLAVPIEDLCRALDILSIKEIETTAFEAALVTDEARSAGHILVNRHSPRLRRRFSIAHELGHFLIEAHQPGAGHPMQCALGDLHAVDTRAKDRSRRIEGEANAFAAHLLMPHKRIREFISRSGVSLETLVTMARAFEVSKEAMARAFVEAYSEPVGVIVSRHGRVERFYRHEDFPFLTISIGQRLPDDSIAPEILPVGTCSEAEETDPDTWLSESAAARTLALTEQALGQRDGYALTLLQAELDEEE